MKISNTSLGDRILPNGTLIPARGTADVDSADWADAQKHQVVKAWLDAKEIVTGEIKGEAPESPRGRDDLIRQAAEGLTDQDRTSDGRPKLEALNAALISLGQDPIKSSNERDEVWARLNP